MFWVGGAPTQRISIWRPGDETQKSRELCFVALTWVPKWKTRGSAMHVDFSGRPHDFLLVKLPTFFDCKRKEPPHLMCKSTGHLFKWLKRPIFPFCWQAAFCSLSCKSGIKRIYVIPLRRPGGRCKKWFMLKFSLINCRCCENLWTFIMATAQIVPGSLLHSSFPHTSKCKSRGRHGGIWFRWQELYSKQFPLLLRGRGDYSSKRRWTVQYLTKLFVLFGGKRLMNRLDWHFQQEGHWSESLLKILIVLFTPRTMDDSEEICTPSTHTCAQWLHERRKGQTLYFISSYMCY